MKELEDQSWFPPLFRSFQTDFLAFAATVLRLYNGFLQHLKNLSIPKQPMIDLCSGSGEPAITIFKNSQSFTHLTLTDKFPPRHRINDHHIQYLPQSVDVLEMQFREKACYTMFNAFHHFSDADKLKIVEKISASDSNAFFVEILEPRLDCLLKVISATTVGTLLLTPFIKPFSWKRLLFTYIIPLNILTITFDGVLSVIKSRSVKQYQHLFFTYGNGIRVQRLRHWFSPVIVIHIQQEK